MAFVKAISSNATLVNLVDALAFPASRQGEAQLTDHGLVAIYDCNKEHPEVVTKRLLACSEVTAVELLDLKKPNGTRKLLTGDVVPEYEIQFPLRQISTRCPDKWVFVDLETGNFYRWDVKSETWNNPPPLAHKAVEKAITRMGKK